MSGGRLAIVLQSVCSWKPGNGDIPSCLAVDLDGIAGAISQLSDDSLASARNVAKRALKNHSGSFEQLRIDSSLWDARIVHLALHVAGIAVTAAAWEHSMAIASSDVAASSALVAIVAVDQNPQKRPRIEAAIVVDRAGIDIRIDTYTAMSHDQLVKVVVNRDAAVVSLKAENHNLRLMLARRDKASETQSDALVAAKAVHDPDNNTFMVERSGTRLTTKGSLAIAIRQMLSQGPAGNLGLTLLDNIARQSVTRCEQKLVACWLAAGARFHHEAESNVAYLFSRSLDDDCAPQALKFGIALHSFKGDATISTVWQKSKLHSMENESMYLYQDCHVRRLSDDVATWKSFSDVQRVADGTADFRDTRTHARTHAHTHKPATDAPTQRTHTHKHSQAFTPHSFTIHGDSRCHRKRNSTNVFLDATARSGVSTRMAGRVHPLGGTYNPYGFVFPGKPTTF